MTGISPRIGVLAVFPSRPATGGLLVALPFMVAFEMPDLDKLVSVKLK